jgi:rare lipoprotein A
MDDTPDSQAPGATVLREPAATVIPERATPPRAAGSNRGGASPRVVAGRRGLMAGVIVAIGVLAGMALITCAPAKREPPPVREPTPAPEVQRGMATFYGGKHHGGPTASGETFNKNRMTAAHRTLRFGTRVRVTNMKNGRSVEVRINDRGPFGNRRRIIDVSEEAARRLGMIEAGVVPVTVEVLP